MHVLARSAAVKRVAARTRTALLAPWHARARNQCVARSIAVASDAQLFHSPHRDIEIPDDCSFSALLMRRAASFGDKTAFRHAASGRAVSYEDMVSHAEAFGSNLTRLGVNPGDRVCIHAPNIPEYPEVFHGTGLAAAVSTTSSPLFTAEELTGQLRDASAKVVVCSASLLPVALPAAADAGLSPQQVIAIDDLQDLPDATGAGELPSGVVAYSEMLTGSVDLPSSAIDARATVATLPYSSGTTGKPKGVMLSHYNLMANMLQLDVTEPLTHDDELIAVLPFYHIYPLMLLMSNTVYKGCTTSVLPRFELDLFLRTLQDRGVRRAHIAPPLAVALAKHPMVDQFDLSKLELLFSGAAPLSPQLEQQVMQRLGVRTKQAYGMTEMSPASHCALDDRLVSGSVGPLLPNTTAKIIDPESGALLGRNEIGEICIRGPQVMMGYLGREDATKETIDQDGFIHTGDTGYVNDDDQFFIVDRVKELVKYKGHQVPPAELEAVLLQHPDVSDAAVVGVRRDEVGETPKAFLVLRDGAASSPEEIVAATNAHLAKYKHVRLVEVIDAIPKSPSGKILRRMLRDRDRPQ